MGIPETVKEAPWPGGPETLPGPAGSTLASWHCQPQGPSLYADLKDGVFGPILWEEEGTKDTSHLFTHFTVPEVHLRIICFGATDHEIIWEGKIPFRSWGISVYL